MNLKINPYLKFLITENIFYLVAAIFILISIFVVPPMLYNTYTENNAKIDSLTKEVQEITSKKNALEFLTSSQSRNIDEYYNLLTSLIPESENYFSIIYSLNNLSELTGFQIISYAINLQASTDNKISLDITGVGDQDNFLSFLKEYNFGGGRLITAEKINLNSEEFTGISLKINFYSKKAPLTQQTNVNYQKILSKIDEIKEKIKFNIQTTSADQSESFEDYPTKANPF